PGADVLPVGIGEPVPDIDEGAAARLDARLVKAVQVGDVSGAGGARAHRRSADPEEWPAIDLERVDETVDILGIDFLPSVGANRQALIALPHRLAVIAAEKHDDEIRLLAVEDDGKLLVPVVDVVTHEAGTGVRLVEHR